MKVNIEMSEEEYEEFKSFIREGKKPIPVIISEIDELSSELSNFIRSRGSYDEMGHTGKVLIELSRRLKEIRTKIN